MIFFKPLKNKDISILHAWLQLAHIREFWDDGHRKLGAVKKHYLKDDGTMRFIISIGDEPIGYIQQYPIERHHPFWIYTQSFPCVGVDFFIGNYTYLGKGLAATILHEFIKKYCFMAAEILVDPDVNNYKALHTYKRLGFEVITDISSKGKAHQLLSLHQSINPPERILVVGKPGSGKASFTQALKKKLGLPLLYLDRLLSSRLANQEDRLAQLNPDMIHTENWIIEEHSFESLQRHYPDAKLCLYLKFPRWHCYLRMLKHLFSKSSESKRNLTWREACSWTYLKYIWHWDFYCQILLRELSKQYPEVTVMELGTKNEISKFEKYLLMVEK
nr:GNAT family N-acetyltransferase [Legionella jordanis]